MKKSNINFTSIPLEKVKVRRLINGVDCGHANALISKLEAKNPEDMALMRAIKKKWGEKSTMTEIICNSFLEMEKMFGGESREFYSLKLDDINYGKDFLGFCSATKQEKLPKPVFHLLYLATNPEFSNQNMLREIKGAGEVLIAKLFQRAKKLDTSAADFFSVNDPFYEHSFAKSKIFFNKEDAIPDKKVAWYNIPAESFDKYIKYCEEKYRFRF